MAFKLFDSLCCVLIYFIFNWGGVSHLPASKYCTKSLKMIWFKWRWVWMPKNSTSLWFCSVSVLQLEALEHYPIGVPLEQMKGRVCWKLHALHVHICTSKNIFPKLAQNWKQNKNAWKHVVNVFVCLFVFHSSLSECQIMQGVF